MAIARINGQMLNSNLERQGVNLAIDANLVYFDVVDRYVGINTTAPQYTFDVRSVNATQSNLKLGNVYLLGNSISTDSGVLNLGSTSNITISGGSLDYVLTTDGSGHLSWANVSTVITATGLTGNLITLGANTQGALTSNALTLTTSTKVTDAIADLNQLLGYFTNSTGTIVSITGNVTAGNVNSTFYGNLYGNVTGTMLTASQPNITTVGTLTGGTWHANTVAIAYGGTNATSFTAPSGTVSGLIYYNGTQLINDSSVIDLGYDTTSNTLRANNITFSGTTIGSIINAATIGNTGTTLTGTLSTASQPNITSIGTLGLLNVAGNVTAGNVVTDIVNAATIGNTGTTLTGTLSTASQTNITSVGTLGLLNVTGNVTAGNVVTDIVNAATIGNTGTTLTGTLSTASQTNITSVGTLGLLNVTGNVTAGNIVSTVYGNAIGTTATYSGNVSANDFVGKLYGNINADLITPYQTQVTVFNSSTALGLPVGSDSQYPTANAAGYIRYNNSLAFIEFYNGTSWQSLTNTITDQQIIPDGINKTFVLNQNTTAVGIIVSINGTLQSPQSGAYTVSGNQITFAEVPLVTDIIDVRFIASAATSVELDYSIVGSANVAVGTTLAIIDSFNPLLYRSVKYAISSTSLYDSQFSEILLTQFNGTVSVNTTGNIRTGGNSITYSANVGGGAVNLLAQSTTNSNQLRITRTYFNI